MPVAPHLRLLSPHDWRSEGASAAPRDTDWLTAPVWPALLLTLAAGVLLLPAFGWLGSSALSLHMVAHIALMNLVAPALALLLANRMPPAATNRLFTATAVQIAVLVLAHAPPALAAAHHSIGWHLLAQAVLLAASFWFWCGVVTAAGARRWRAIAALLVTGKVFCLVGAIFTFAPRPLVQGLPLPLPEALADQQLAGLLMLAACPLTYVLAGIVVSVLWLAELTAEAG